MSYRKKIVVANWKMNPPSLKEATKIFNDTKKFSGRSNTEIVICPPYIYLNQFRKSRLALGVQDLSISTVGAHTGEISAEMVAKNGAKYVIIGHSERRAMGETDEIVNKKIENALSENLKVILCVGEKVRDEHGEYLNFIKAELRNSLKRVNRKYLKNFLIAYEPIFAVGNKNYAALSPHDIYQMVIFIRKHLVEHFNDADARKVPILYGGSVEEKNAADIIKNGGVDGFLVGRQSLDPKGFGGILKASSKI